MVPQLSGKARGHWEQVVSCFRSIDEKIGIIRATLLRAIS